MGNRQQPQNNRSMPAPSQMPAPDSQDVALDVEAPPAPDEDIPDEVVPPVPVVAPQPIGPFEVITVDEGFFGGQRRSRDERFMVDSMEEVGSWMQCVDPKLEKIRAALIKTRKEQAKAGR